jgi:hypothetical protein
MSCCCEAVIRDSGLVIDGAVIGDSGLVIRKGSNASARCIGIRITNDQSHLAIRDW